MNIKNLKNFIKMVAKFTKQKRLEYISIIRDYFNLGFMITRNDLKKKFSTQMSSKMVDYCLYKLLREPYIMKRFSTKFHPSNQKEIKYDIERKCYYIKMTQEEISSFKKREMLNGN